MVETFWYNIEQKHILLIKSALNYGFRLKVTVGVYAFFFKNAQFNFFHENLILSQNVFFSKAPLPNVFKKKHFIFLQA